MTESRRWDNTGDTFFQPVCVGVAACSGCWLLLAVVLFSVRIPQKTAAPAAAAAAAPAAPAAPAAGIDAAVASTADAAGNLSSDDRPSTRAAGLPDIEQPRVDPKPPATSGDVSPLSADGSGETAMREEEPGDEDEKRQSVSTRDSSFSQVPLGASITAVPKQSVSVRAATRSTLSESTLDDYGNPSGNDLGLLKNHSLAGVSILLWVAEPDGGFPNPRQYGIDARVFASMAATSVKSVLTQAGADIILQMGTPVQERRLKGFDQVWVFSGPAGMLDSREARVLAEFARRGGGLCLLADNAPMVSEADRVARELFKVSVSGYDQGMKVMAVGDLPDAVREKHHADFSGPFHTLLSDINFIYEGATVSRVNTSSHLDIVMRNSSGGVVCAVARAPKMNVVIDCGYTRYFPRFLDRTAGTRRFLMNAVAWLSGQRSEP